MKVLKFSENLFGIVGVHTFRGIKRPYGEYFKAFSFFVISATFGTMFGTSAAYIYQNFRDLSQLAEMIMAFVGVFTCSANFGSYNSIVLRANAVKKLSKELQDIVNKGSELIITKNVNSLVFLGVFSDENGDGFEIYSRTERRCRFVTKWVLLYTLINIAVVSTSFSIIHSIVCMRRGNFDTKTWFF